MIRLLKNETEIGISIYRFIGAKILSSAGEYCGRVIGLYVAGGKLTGFSVWFRRKIIYMDISYIANLNSFSRQRSLLLSEIPYYTILGKIVYDADGKKLGVVKAVEQKGTENDYNAFTVKKFIFSRSVRFQKHLVQLVRKSVIVEVEDSNGKKK